MEIDASFLQIQIINDMINELMNVYFSQGTFPIQKILNYNIKSVDILFIQFTSHSEHNI